MALDDEILRSKTMLRADQPVYSLAEALEQLDLNEEDLKDIIENSDEVKID